jgi:hypothetical protein
LDFYRIAYSLLVAVAVAAWAVAAVSAWRMLEHREPNRSRFWFATNGIAFFTGKGFLPSAQPHRRLMLRAAAAFFGAIVAAIVLTFLAASNAPSS